MKKVIDEILIEATILGMIEGSTKTTDQALVLKEAKNIEMINRIGEILSEASIFDSKYEEGSKFLALSSTKQILDKALPAGAKTPKGPFTKKAAQKKFIEVPIGKGPTVFVHADDTKKLYKITASANQFKSMFGKMKKGAGQGDINWNTDTLETAACFGLFVNGVSILETLNSTKSQDDLPKAIANIRQKVNKAISSSGEYSAADKIQSKLETMPITDWYILAQLMAGMTQFTDKVPKFSPKYLILKGIRDYYKATERSELVSGVKDNTADAVVCNVPPDELISALNSGRVVKYSSKGICSMNGGKIKFIQLSLKKGKDSAQLGKIYGFLKDKYNLLDAQDVLDLAISEGFSDFFKKGKEFIKSVGGGLLKKITDLSKMIYGFNKKIISNLRRVPKESVANLEKQLQKAGLNTNLKESINNLSEARKQSMWDSFGKIGAEQKLLDVVVDNTNKELVKLKKAANKNNAFYYEGYEKLKIKAPIGKDAVAKLLTNFQSAIVLQNLFGDLSADAKKLYSQMVEIEKEMIYGKTTLPLYKVYGVSKDGGGEAFEMYPGATEYIKEKTSKNMKDVVVFFLKSSKQKYYFTLSGYGLSGISEKTGDLKYSQFRMGTNSSGQYSYNFEGTQEMPLGAVKKSLNIK
jgi:hypothetical protein